MKCKNCGNEMGYDFEGSVEWLKCNKCGEKLYLSRYSPRETNINFLLNERYKVSSEFMRLAKEQLALHGKDAKVPEFEEGHRKADILNAMLKELGHKTD